MSQLCQLTDVKTYLGITVTATDAALTALITNVSAAIESFCNRTFEQASYKDTYNGTERSTLYLREGPVTAVTAVSIDGIAVGAAPDAVSAGYVFDEQMVYLRGHCIPARFNRGVQNVTVSYTAGYVTIPADVNQACVSWVADLFAKRTRIDKKNETLGTQQTQGYDLSDMPATVRTVLQPYVRFVP